MLIINEALYFGDSLLFSLLSPVQLRDNDVHVDERHCQLNFWNPRSIGAATDPFHPRRRNCRLDTRPPTQDELDDTALHIELTSDVEWIPHTFADSLAEEEDTIKDDVNEEKIINLRARRLKVLDSTAAN